MKSTFFYLALIPMLVSCGPITVNVPDYSEDPQTEDTSCGGTEAPQDCEETPRGTLGEESSESASGGDSGFQEETPKTPEPLLLLRKGLTMDQVADILGEPDDSGSRAGTGRTWFYEMDSEKCKVSERFNRCAVYFDGNGRLEYVVNIKPEYKDHRTWE